MQTGDHRRARTLTLVLLLCAFASPAHADEKQSSWHSGYEGHRRLRNLAITGALGVTFLTAKLVAPNPTSCRWCSPPSFDRSVRDAVVWDNKARAGLYSDIDTFVLAPILGFGLLVAVDYDAGWARIIDDIMPVAAAVAVSETITLATKIGFARRRPEAQFRDPGGAAGTSDNQSFVSGHSSLGFAITAASGMMCHWRGYWTEPYVWGVGIALSVSTEYLRMGADKHYLSDVLVGGAVGLASGLLVPRLFRHDIAVVPGKSSVTLATKF